MKEPACPPGSPGVGALNLTKANDNMQEPLQSLADTNGHGNARTTNSNFEGQASPVGSVYGSRLSRARFSLYGSRRLEDRKKSTLFGSICNMCVAMIGAGQLTLPYAMSQAGLGVGIGIMVFMAFAHSCVNCLVLAECSRMSGGGRYCGVLRELLGEWAQKSGNVLILLYCFGTTLSFLLITEQQLRLLALAWAPSYRDRWEDSGDLSLIAFIVVIVWPLSCLRDLSALAPVGILGCFAAVWICCLVVVESLHRGLSECAIIWTPELTGQGMLRVGEAVPMLAFALNSSWAFLPVMHELERPTVPRVLTLTVTSHALVLTMYLVLAFFGYTAFHCAHGGKIKDNILDELGETGPVLLSRVMLAAQLLVSSPMRLHIMRNAALGERQRRRWIHFVVSTLCVAVPTILACLVKSLHTVVSLNGAMCASLIIYIIPACMFTKLKTGDGGKMGAALTPIVSLFLLGAAVMILGVISNVAEIMSSK